MHLVDLVPFAADPAFVIGSDRQLLSVNEAAAALVGEPADVLVGRPCSEVIAALHPGGERVCQSQDCPVFRSMEERRPMQLGWSDWATPDGRVLPISGTTVAAPDDDGGEVALLIVHVAGQPAPVPVLDVRLLGETSLFIGGTPAALPRRRRSLEMIYRLAVAGPCGVRRDQLLEEFWPDSPMEDSGLRLRVLLHAVRQVLVSAGLNGALMRRGDVYLLDTAGLRIDAVEFDRLAERVLHAPLAEHSAELAERAMRAYRGELGAGEHFGDWAIGEVERLRRLYHALLRRSAQYFAQHGAVDRSVECCRMALQSDPLQEQFQIALIAYYGHLGRREDAVRQYEDYRRVLAAEVGASPPATTLRALEQALATAG